MPPLQRAVFAARAPPGRPPFAPPCSAPRPVRRTLHCALPGTHSLSHSLPPVPQFLPPDCNCHRPYPPPSTRVTLHHGCTSTPPPSSGSGVNAPATEERGPTENRYLSAPLALSVFPVSTFPATWQTPHTRLSPVLCSLSCRNPASFRQSSGHLHFSWVL